MSDWGRPDQGQRHHWDGCRWSSTWAGSKWRWRGRRCGCTCQCRMPSFQRACSSPCLRLLLPGPGVVLVLAEAVAEELSSWAVAELLNRIASCGPSASGVAGPYRTSFQAGGMDSWVGRLVPCTAAACSSRSPWSGQSRKRTTTTTMMMDDISGQSYKQFTLVNYDSRVVTWTIS